MNQTSLYNFVAIEGNIGVGKSTLAKLLANKLKAKLILEEFEDNSFLPKFYNDQRRYAFPLEMSFLAARFNQLKTQLLTPDLFKTITISDYIFAKCLLFSKVTLEEDEYELYYKLFDIINLQLPKPDLLIYLHSPIEKLQHNIKIRGRNFEQEITNDYLQNIQNAYLNYLQNNQQQRTVIINSNNVDFVSIDAHYQQLENCLYTNFKLGINHITIT